MRKLLSLIVVLFLVFPAYTWAGVRVRIGTDRVRWKIVSSLTKARINLAAPILVGCTGTNDGSASAQTTISINVGTGPNRAIIVQAGNDRSSSETVSSMTYAGRSMTSSGISITTAFYDTVYYLSNPTSGTNNLVINWSGSGTALRGIITTVWNNVDVATPISGATSNTAGGTSISTNVTSRNGDVVLDFTNTDSGAYWTPDATQTNTCQTSFAFRRQSTKPGGTSTTMAWTGLNSFVGQIALSVRGARYYQP